MSTELRDKQLDAILLTRGPNLRGSASQLTSKWVELFAVSSTPDREEELFLSVLSANGLLTPDYHFSFPQTRAGTWSIIAFDQRFACKLYAGKRRDGVYEGYDPDEAALMSDEYWMYSRLLLEGGLKIPSKRSIRVIPNPSDRKRVYLFEVQEKIQGVDGLSLLRPHSQVDAPNPAVPRIIFEQTLRTLLPVLQRSQLCFGLDPHPANFIYDPNNLTETPTFIDLLPPRPKNGLDQRSLLQSSEAFYKRRLHLLYEPTGLVKYLYNAFAVADPTMSGYFAEQVLAFFRENDALYAAIRDYFCPDSLNERMRDWNYMQRIFRAMGRPERAQSFRGNSIYITRLPYYFIPEQVINDRRLDELDCRSRYWTELIKNYLGDSWSNDGTQVLSTRHPKVSINMTMTQKRSFNLRERIDDFERFSQLVEGDTECVIVIGHPLSVAAFEEIKVICSKATFPIKIIINKSSHPNISRNLATTVSTGEVRFITDDDCYVPCETFMGLYNRLIKNDNLVAVGTSSVNPDGKQHKPETRFPSQALGGSLLKVPGVHGMAFMIRGQYMDKYPIPPRIGKRGDWLPFFSMAQDEMGACVYDLSLPPIQHRFKAAEGNFSISRRKFAGFHAVLSMMHTLYEIGDQLKSGTTTDLYLRDHYLGETLDDTLQEEGLSVLWENLKAICTDINHFSYSPHQIYERMIGGLNQEDLGSRNRIMLRWAGRLYLRNQDLVKGAKTLTMELTGGQLHPPFWKYN